MKHGKLTAVAMIVLVVGFAESGAWAKIITVDCNGPSDFNSIQEAIDHADHNDTIVVYPCVYYEHINLGDEGVTVKGTKPSDMNVVEATVIDGSGVGDVITFGDVERGKSILRGITVQNGERGIQCANPSAVIRDCIVKDNSVVGVHSGSATIHFTLVEDNNDGIIDGGRITGCQIRYNSRDGLVDPRDKVVNCVISGNGGNGVRYSGLGQSSAIIKNCTIVGNKADGICTRCCCMPQPLWSFSNNIVALNCGAGIEFVEPVSCISPRLHYNDVWGNSGGNYQGELLPSTDIEEDPCFAEPGYWGDVNDPNIRIECNAPNAIWIDGDYHLKSGEGRWHPDSNSWVNDVVNSPCIDAGHPCSWLDEEPNPNGGRINQGAYGGTDEASKSQPPCLQVGMTDACGHTITQADYDLWLSLGAPNCWCHWCHCKGDSNADCQINAVDVLALRAAWPGFLDTTYDPCVDANYDGMINAVDVLALRNAWPGLGGLGCSNVPCCQPDW